MPLPEGAAWSHQSQAMTLHKPFIALHGALLPIRSLPCCSEISSGCAAVAQVQIWLDGQESACSEEATSQEDVKPIWGSWVPKGPFLTLRLPQGGWHGLTHALLCRRQCSQQPEGPAPLKPPPEVRGAAGSISLGWAAWGLGVHQYGTALGCVRGGGGDTGTARLHTCHGEEMHTGLAGGRPVPMGQGLSWEILS